LNWWLGRNAHWLMVEHKKSRKTRQSPSPLNCQNRLTPHCRPDTAKDSHAAVTLTRPPTTTQRQYKGRLLFAMDTENIAMDTENTPGDP